MAAHQLRPSARAIKTLKRLSLNISEVVCNLKKKNQINPTTQNWLGPWIPQTNTARSESKVRASQENEQASAEVGRLARRRILYTLAAWAMWVT